MKGILFLEPVLKKMIWGGNRLKTFNYDFDDSNIGEVWCVSAHKNGMTKVIGYDETLNELWKNNVDLFGVTTGEFPLLIKYIDALSNLSVQVHPNDEEALKLENEPYGKTECWYILDCLERSNIVYGHHAKTKSELKNMIELQKWDDLLNYIEVKKDDMYLVEAGTIHAIGSGVMILEIQQSSDTTYRVYDYDRTDEFGNGRELHLEKSLEVIKFNENNSKIEYDLNSEFVQLVKNKYFNVYKMKINGEKSYQNEYFTCVNVISGSGFVNDLKIKKGDNFILSKLITEVSFTGNLEIILSTV